MTSLVTHDSRFMIKQSVSELTSVTIFYINLFAASCTTPTGSKQYETSYKLRLKN